MRTPTTRDQAYRWWNAMVSGTPFRLPDDEVQAGYFKKRKWPRGPWIPARIWLEPGSVCPETGELLTDEVFKAEIDGKPAPLDRVWLSAHPIPFDEWTWLTAQSPLLPDKAKPPRPQPFERR